MTSRRGAFFLSNIKWSFKIIDGTESLLYVCPMIPQPTAPNAPQLPGSPAGAPAGPGASPMASPGGGAGNAAAAVAQLKSVVPVLYKILAAFPFGSKENSAVQRALTALSPIAGKTEESSLVPSAIQQMALAAKGGPLKNAPPVGLAAAPPPESPDAAGV